MADTPKNEKGTWWPRLRPSLLNALRFLSFVGLVVAANQLCLQDPFFWSCRCLAYSGLTVGLASFIAWRYLQHDVVARKGRLMDEGEVKGSIVDAKTVEPRMRDPLRPEGFEEKKGNLNDEIERLEAMGKENWTEYEVLSLYQMLVDFLKPSELVSTTDSVMDDLEEYAADSKYRYDRDYYAKWKERVDEAKEKIGASKDIAADDECEDLRAVLKTIYEHVADFRFKWAQGSALIRDLLIVNAAAIPVVLTLGLIPVIHPSDPSTLDIMNWAMFGAAGSLTGSLLSLHKSDFVEVGNTEGKQEIWRAFSGAALGLVAGALTFGVIAGGLITGIAVPEVDVTPITAKGVGLSLIWGVASGFSFERVFERVRTATEGAG